MLTYPYFVHEDGEEHIMDEGLAFKHAPTPPDQAHGTRVLRRRL